MLNKILTLTMASFVVLMAEPNYGETVHSNFVTPQSDKEGNAKDEVGQIIKRDRFEINVDTEVVEDIAKKKIDFEKAMSLTYDMDISNTPLVKPLPAIDFISVSSEYFVSIIFPEQYGVMGVNSTGEYSYKQYTENMIKFKVARNFVQGNFLVSLTNGRENKTLQIFLKRLIPNEHREQRTGAYGEGKTTFYSMIKYVAKPSVSNIEILEAYFKLFSKPCRAVFKHDGDFDIFILQGYPFYIVRDDKFGTIESDGINFRIATESQSFGEQVER